HVTGVQTCALPIFCFHKIESPVSDGIEQVSAIGSSDVGKPMVGVTGRKNVRDDVFSDFPGRDKTDGVIAYRSIITVEQLFHSQVEICQYSFPNQNFWVFNY